VSRRQRRLRRQRRRSARALAAVAVTAVLGAVGALAGIAGAEDSGQPPRSLRRAPVAIEPSLVTASATVQARAEERFSLAAFQNAVARQSQKSARDSIWDRIAACETQGDWSMRGPSFSGGVGFSNAAWNSWGGSEFAPNAGQATREQQVIVAERIRASVGLGAWGCAKKLGLTGG
jgi:hypothetical protein